MSTGASEIVLRFADRFLQRKIQYTHILHGLHVAPGSALSIKQQIKMDRAAPGKKCSSSSPPWCRETPSSSCLVENVFCESVLRAINLSLCQWDNEVLCSNIRIWIRWLQNINHHVPGKLVTRFIFHISPYFSTLGCAFCQQTKWTLCALFQIMWHEWRHSAGRQLQRTWSFCGRTVCWWSSAVSARQTSKHKRYNADLRRMDVLFTNYQPELKVDAAWKQSANC